MRGTSIPFSVLFWILVALVAFIIVYFIISSVYLNAKEPVNNLSNVSSYTEQANKKIDNILNG